MSDCKGNLLPAGNKSVSIVRVTFCQQEVKMYSDHYYLNWLTCKLLSLLLCIAVTFFFTDIYAKVASMNFTLCFNFTVVACAAFTG